MIRTLRGLELERCKGSKTRGIKVTYATQPSNSTLCLLNRMKGQKCTPIRIAVSLILLFPSSTPIYRVVILFYLRYPTVIYFTYGQLDLKL